jgi:tRNA pseudouridine55 synthase
LIRIAVGTWMMTDPRSRSAVRGPAADGPVTSPARKPRRDVSGILVLDKPTGMTSNRALQRVRGIFQARKAGHTGSLDPLASGMLPICLGEATKISGFLLNAPKTYEVVARLGSRTDTGDSEGKVIERADWSGISLEGVRSALADFLGDIEQVPPMYSALKHKGRRLYTLARQGKVVDRPARPVTIYRLEAVALEDADLSLKVCCSKGTYIRTLAEDVAAALGSVAHVIHLRRTGVGGLDGAPLVTLPALEGMEEKGLTALDSLLMPPDAALPQLSAVHLDRDMARRVSRGQRLQWNGRETGTVRLYAPDGSFLGLGEAGRDGVLSPRRMFACHGAGGAAGSSDEGGSKLVANDAGKVQ